MLLSFIPFIDTLVRTNLIANSPVADGLGIAGHIEWFDLINETLQAFLIIPLYALLNKCEGDVKKFKERVFQSFLAVNTIYILFSVFIFVYCRKIVLAMTFERISEVTIYLELETIGFIIANVVSFINVVFVILGKPIYICKSDLLSGHIWIGVKRHICTGYNFYLSDVRLWHGCASGVQYCMFLVI